jgi:hypothetical protein
MIITDAYRDWIVEDLTGEHLDGEPGELVGFAGWVDLHGAQAAATP